MKKVLLAILSMVLLLSLAACGGSSDSSKDKDGKEEIVMWGSWSGDQIKQLEKQIDSYNKSQDKYKVKYVNARKCRRKIINRNCRWRTP